MTIVVSDKSGYVNFRLFFNVVVFAIIFAFIVQQKGANTVSYYYKAMYSNYTEIFL